MMERRAGGGAGGGGSSRSKIGKSKKLSLLREDFFAALGTLRVAGAGRISIGAGSGGTTSGSAGAARAALAPAGAVGEGGAVGAAGGVGDAAGAVAPSDDFRSGWAGRSARIAAGCTSGSAVAAGAAEWPAGNASRSTCSDSISFARRSTARKVSQPVNEETSMLR
jgi:hypothetical protein